MKHSPLGCSVSKSPNLLRNTFSVEMYGEFLKMKKKLRNSKLNQTLVDTVHEEDKEEKIKVEG